MDPIIVQQRMYALAGGDLQRRAYSFEHAAHLASMAHTVDSPPDLTSQEAAHWICTKLLELEYTEES